MISLTAFVVCFCILNLRSAHGQIEVWLTVSSPANNESERLIELHWRNAGGAKKDDQIALFNENPLNPTKAVETFSVNEKESGTVRCKTQFPYYDFPLSNVTKRCLPYFVGYIEANSTIIATNCIKTNPFWMEESLPWIGKKALKDIMIPGTHDAGSYEKYTWRDPSKDFIIKYVMTQDESIYNQLVYGIRYFDIRVGWYDIKGEEEKFWIVHDFFRMNHTLLSVIKQIRSFLDATSEEIIIFDFHRFVNGFQDKDKDIVKKRHEEVFELLKEHLRDYMIPFSYGYEATIETVLKSNKRVLIGYLEKDNYIKSDLLWPNCVHQWGNVDELDGLEKYFNNTICSDKNKRRLRSAMAELTPTIDGIIQDKYKGLRHLAQIVNPQITNWFRDRFHNCANIVSPDYFLGSNIIEVVINVNKKRAGKKFISSFRG